MDVNPAIDRQWAYEIKVEGRLGERWSDWLNGLTICCEATAEGSAPVTTLTTLAIDQATLRGIVTRLWNLNLDLISVERLEQK